VTIGESFAVGKFEVTFLEWDACVAAGGCSHKPDDNRWGRGKHPVVAVSWDDTKEYVAWLSKKTRQTYRLLTEAEWEYAARGGTSTLFAFGNQVTDKQAQYARGKTAEVGSFKPNDIGLYDMHGNAGEWVEDCFYGYDRAARDGTAQTQGDSDCTRVLRGGSLLTFPVHIRRRTGRTAWS
jgi:formylglycine-generating enzyme required for sulfatase activity